MAEIRRSPVEVGSLSHYLQGFSTIPGGAGFLPSTVGLHFINNSRPSLSIGRTDFQQENQNPIP